MNPNQIINQPMELNCLQINLRHSKLAAADILISLPLSILHQLARNLNFVPGGKSMIDVTLGGDKTNVIDWQFLDFDSLSDHPFVMVYSGRLPFVAEIQTNSYQKWQWRTRRTRTCRSKTDVFSAGGQADSQSSPFRKRDERPVSNTNTSRKSLTNLSGFTADDDSIGRLGVYNWEGRGGHSQGHNTFIFFKIVSERSQTLPTATRQHVNKGEHEFPNLNVSTNPHTTRYFH